MGAEAAVRGHFGLWDLLGDKEGKARRLPCSFIYKITLQPVPPPVQKEQSSLLALLFSVYILVQTIQK